MPNWFLDLFMRRKRKMTASAKLGGFGSAAARPRSRLLALVRLRGMAAFVASTGGAGPTGRQFSTGFNGAFSAAAMPAANRQFADEFTDGFA